MPYHIIIKQQEKDVLKKLIEKFTEPKFIVREEADSGEHWHVWLNIDYVENKMRRELDKCRDNKVKGVSVRKWDNNLGYFCKGTFKELPEIIVNEVITEEEVKRLHDDWWKHKWNTPVDPDYKEPKLLDEFVDACRDQDLTYRQAAKVLIKILLSKNGKKMFCNKSVGQAYIRTALAYTKNADKYTLQYENFLCDNPYN